MTDILDSARKDIEKRLHDLRDELRRLEAAASALAGTAARGRRGPGRPRGSKTRSRTRRGRPRGGGTRSAQALKLVQQNPGITIPELASKMRIKPNYLYRVLPELQSDGKVKKRNKGWHAA